MSRSRRGLLSTLGVSLIAGAGCLQDVTTGTGGESTTGTGEDPTTTGRTTETGAESTTTTATGTDSGGSLGSWPMVAFDAGNTNHYGAVDGFEEEPDRRWRNPWAAEFQGGDGLVPAPLLVDDHLLVEDDSGEVFPIDARSGEVRDPNPVGFEFRRPVIATTEGVYSVGLDRESERIALAAQDPDGELRWKEPLPARRAVLAGDTVYVAVHDDDRPVSGVVALDRSTGTERWRRTVAVDQPSFVAATGERVFVATGAVLQAYATASGDRLWRFEIPERVDADLRFGRPRLTDDRVLLGAFGNATADPVPRLWALPRSGPPGDWTWDDETGIRPRVVTERVAVGGGLAIDVETGTERWSRAEFLGELVGSGGKRVWDAAASEGTLFLGTGDNTGLGEGDGTLAALDLEDGAPRWQVTVPGGVRHVVVGDGRLFVVTLRGAIEAYG